MFLTSLLAALIAIIPVTEPVPYDLVDERPTFQDGDLKTFNKWVNSQLVWPVELREMDWTGRVNLEFTVDTDGSVKDITVTRSLEQHFDEESFRVISMSPKWKPGKHGGHTVPVRVQFSVIWILR